MGRTNWRGVVGLVVLTGVLLGTRPVGADVLKDWPHERWYVVMMFGSKVGWMKSERTVDAEGHLVSSEEMKFSMGRMGQDIEMEIRSRFVETVDGRAIEIMSFMNLGGSPTETVYRFSEDGETITETTQRGNGPPRSKEIKRPAGSWMTRGEVSRFVEKRLEAGAETIAYATIDGSSGLRVILVRSVVKERTTIEALGKRVPAIRWESTTSIMPNVTMESFVDEQGEDIRSTVNLGGITMEMIATEREVALSPFDTPEIMVGTLVEPEGDIAEPRSSRQGSFVLRLTGDDARTEMPDLVTAGGQRVERIGPRAARVTIDLDNPVVLSEANRDEWFDQRYAGSSMMIDLQDEKLRETLDEALRGVPANADDATKAEAIRKFVFRFIDNKNLGVGFASASETCRTREGDCSEHAALLTALLRLAGIPSRTVSGLVFVDQFMQSKRVFGFHMWSQALLPAEPGADGEPCWVWTDLDAAISPTYPTDAARIAVVTSTLADDDMINSMVDIAVLMGQLSIEVEEAAAVR